MEGSTLNAGETIEALTLMYNCIEIISGASALEEK